MTAHRTKPTITPDRIAWFTAYHRKHLGWGAFHSALDDGNYRYHHHNVDGLHCAARS